MPRKFRSALILAALVGVLAMPAASRAEGGVKVGILTCNVSSGWGFVFGSSRELNCTYSPGGTGAKVERYAGTISKWGIDIGYQQSAVIVWAVFAPTANVAPGALAGDYGGVTAGASIAVGLGANVLIGGSNQQIALQPLSVEGNQGLNVAAGIAAITLKTAP
ncbi:MAG TPA: DUF992 domain-containing protein [Stellaceae bacterium]|nr:DUF992 domain-containing protein [Stellaceae bacterium]